MTSQTQCPCPKWNDVISAHQLSVLLQKHLEHPEYCKDFKIHQPCFMCQNDDQIECYGTDEFNAAELLSKLTHPVCKSWVPSNGKQRIQIRVLSGRLPFVDWQVSVATVRPVTVDSHWQNSQHLSKNMVQKQQ